MKFRINRDGTIKKLQLLSSTVGCYDVERCVLGKLGESRFEHPTGGGEAEFTYPLTFPARMGVLEWQEARVRKPLAKWRKKMRRRRRKRRKAQLVAPRGLVLTFYINRHGRLATAGMVAQEEIERDFAEKLVEALKKVKLPEPHSRYAKVTYRW